MNENNETKETPVIPLNPQQDKPLTKIELANKAIEEGCQKYNIMPRDIAMALGKHLQEQADILKNEAKMFENESIRLHNKVEYKEYVARDINASKVIDGHAKEMQEYEQNVKTIILEWIKVNSNSEIDAMMSIIEQELNLPYDEIRRDVDSKINQEVEKRMSDVISNQIQYNREERNRLRSRLEQFIDQFSTSSRKDRKKLTENYLILFAENSK